jgi:hypothetical protein
MGKFGCLVGKNVLANQELRGGQFVLHFSDVGFRVSEVFSKDVECPDLPGQKAFHHLGNHESVLFRQPGHTPGIFEF